MLRLVLAALLMLVVGASAAAVTQPTFGNPKPGKPKASKPTPAPAAPKPGEGETDIHEKPSPDTPEPASPMFEPGPGKTEFVPSPEEWLETDPPRHEPAADLTPGATYAWRSADGLRYSYTVPANYKSGEGYDVVIVCHPEGNDFHWGLANHLSLKAAEERGSARLAFRPNNVVVSVDGVGADRKDPRTRWFTCDNAATVRFRDFVLEMTRVLPARRIFLYGCGGGADEEGGASGGGQFVMYFAQSFPALADGVIAYGAGKPVGTLRRCNVPVVIVHGVKNGVAPFSDALAALRANVKQENKLVRLRALRAFNDYPNPVRVSECIEWLTGVRTDDPKEALTAVETMLVPKSGDEYDYLCPVWYAGAREILGRVLAEPGALTGETPFEGKNKPTDAVLKRAREIVALLDAEAATHVAALTPWLGEPRRIGDMVLDGEPWLGHLVAARDDFRGVATMEAFAARIGYDDAARSHAEAAAPLIADWLTGDDAENFALAGASLPNCFLEEGLPVNLTLKMKRWQKQHQSGELDLPAEALEAAENVFNWDEGYRKGLDAYQRIWRRWRFEPGVSGAASAEKNSVEKTAGQESRP